MNRKKLFTVITILVLVLIVASGFIASMYTRDRLTESLVVQYGKQEAVVARQLAKTIDLRIDQTRSRLTLTSKLTEIVSGSSEVCNKRLDEIFEDPQTNVGNIIRVDKDGYIKCSTDKDLMGTKAELARPYINDIFDDPEHKPIMSRAIKPVGESSYLVAIHVPVWGVNGEFTGTLGGAIYFDDLEETYLEDLDIAPGANIELLDDDGTVLYHILPELRGKNLASPDYQSHIANTNSPQEIIQEIKEGLSGSSRYSFDDTEKIAAYSAVTVFPSRNWRVHVTIPVEAARQSVAAMGTGRFLMELPMMLALITFGLFGLFIWVTKQEVFSPMEAVDKAKSEFVSLASHQLRTPLSTINWYSEMLLAGDAGKLNPEQTEFMNEIYNGNQRMVELVNALLNVSRIDLGTFAVEPQPTDIRIISDSVLNELKPQIETREINVSKNYDSDFPIINLDQKLIRIVIQNLLTNAVKYTPPKGSVTIELTREKNNVQIKVSDTGYGIPEDQQGKIFTKLFRADNVREKETDGTGLGLYIVKSVIEQSGGKVWFTSQLNKGTTFYVTIPTDGMDKKEGVKGLS